MSDLSTVYCRFNGADQEYVDKASGTVVFAFRNAAGSMPCEGTADNLTAHSGGTQGPALQLTAQLNRVTTVAAANDSVKLPVSVAGLTIQVTNAAATNALDVYPQTGDAINALSANAEFTVNAGKTATFTCYTAGQWHSILSA
jgi:hypothetical protein